MSFDESGQGPMLEAASAQAQHVGSMVVSGNDNQVILQVSKRTAEGESFLCDRGDPFGRANLVRKSRNALKEGEAAFEHAVDVQLGIREVPHLVCSPRLPHLGVRGTVDSRPLTTPLLDHLLSVERLLLVGAPGAGKTQTLRTIWEQLLQRAEGNSSLPIPFLVNLSTFGKYQGSLRDWLAESLWESVGIPVAKGKCLLQEGKLFLLLDGLDEMAAERRQSALSELNELLRVGARYLQRESATLCLLERIQPSVLSARSLCLYCYQLSYGLLVYGLVAGLVIGLIYGAAVGLTYGLVVGLVVGLPGVRSVARIKPVEQLRAMNWK